MPSNYADAILFYAAAAQIMSNHGEDSDAEADALWTVFKQARLLVVRVDDDIKIIVGAIKVIVGEHLASMGLDGTSLHLIDVQPGVLVA